MSFLQSVRENKDALLRGASLLVGGLALILAGSLVGLAEPAPAQVLAGTLAVGGIVVAFLGFFVYVLPPLLPAK